MPDRRTTTAWTTPQEVRGERRHQTGGGNIYTYEAVEAHPGRVRKYEIDHLISRNRFSTLAVATCALNNNVIISHSVGPDRGLPITRRETSIQTAGIPHS